MQKTDAKTRLSDFMQQPVPPAYKRLVTLVDSIVVDLLLLQNNATYRRNQICHLVRKEMEQIEKWKRE